MFYTFPLTGSERERRKERNLFRKRGNKYKEVSVFLGSDMQEVQTSLPILRQTQVWAETQLAWQNQGVMHNQPHLYTQIHLFYFQLLLEGAANQTHLTSITSNRLS